MNAALTPRVRTIPSLRHWLLGIAKRCRSNHFPLFVGSLLVIILVYTSTSSVLNTRQETRQTAEYISSPKIDDLYFLDVRLLPGTKPGTLRPNEKYRLAKVVDITGDIVTLVYGNFFYLRQRAIVKSIQYGQLRYPDYFETRRYDFPTTQLAAMKDSGAIYRVKRPVYNTLFGNQISPPKPVYRSSVFIPGKRQNQSGLAQLKSTTQENHLQLAFEHFQASADLGYAPAQINLAHMYLQGQHVKQDLNLALFWFKQAALQSHKPGILKYEIVCKQVPECNILDFFDELIDAGVNVKVRQLDFTLK